MPNIKNIEFSKAVNMADQVSYLDGQVVSKTLAQNKAVSVTLFAFDQGEEISTHESTGDAMVYCLDGEGEITIGGQKSLLQAGQCIVMPSNVPHMVYAPQKFKMMLVVIFPNT